jgi:hypothetical protein
MTINIFETNHEFDPSQGRTIQKQTSKTISISDEEILNLLGKLLATKKEVIIDLLKDKHDDR